MSFEKITLYKIGDSHIPTPSESVPPFLIAGNSNVRAISDYNLRDDSLIKDVEFIPYYVYEYIKLIKFDDICRFLERHGIKHNKLKSQYGGYFIIDRSIADLFREVGVDSKKINYEKYEDWYITGRCNFNEPIQYSMIKITPPTDTQGKNNSTATLTPLDIDLVEYTIVSTMEGETMHQACISNLNKNLERITSGDNIPEFQVNDLVYYSDDQISNDSNYMNEMESNSIQLINLSTKNNTSPKSGNQKSTKESDWIEAMKDQYGFTSEEVKLLSDSYKKFEDWIKRMEYNECISYTNQEKCQMFFGYLSALNPNYSSADWKFSLAGASSTPNALYNLMEMGIDADSLQKVLIEQHSSCTKEKKRDFVHECAILAYTPSSALNLASTVILQESFNDLIGFKGDVYSASMNIDDAQSDVAGVNIYNRIIKSEDGNIFKVMAEYCKEEEQGKINPVDEFLESFGNGDADKGMRAIKKNLNKKTSGTKKVQKSISDQDVENTKRFFIDYLEEMRSK